MPVSLEEVRQVIQQEFPDTDVNQITEEDHRVIGTIRSAEFKGKDSRERNRLVTEKVREKLGHRGINIGILFPLAPGERL